METTTLFAFGGPAVPSLLLGTPLCPVSCEKGVLAEGCLTGVYANSKTKTSGLEKSPG